VPLDVGGTSFLSSGFETTVLSLFDEVAGAIMPFHDQIFRPKFELSPCAGHSMLFWYRQSGRRNQQSVINNKVRHQQQRNARTVATTSKTRLSETLITLIQYFITQSLRYHGELRKG
jgi:hypothetical protein